MPTYTKSPNFQYDQILSASGHLNALRDNANTLFDLHWGWQPGTSFPSLGRHVRANSYDLDTTPHATEGYLDADPQEFDFFESGWHYNATDAQYAGYYLVEEFGFKMMFPYLYLRCRRNGGFSWQIRFYKVNPDHDRDDWDAEPYEISYTYTYAETLSDSVFRRLWTLASIPDVNLMIGDYYRVEIWCNADHDTPDRFFIYGCYEAPSDSSPVGQADDYETMRAFTDADCTANGTPDAADWQTLSNNLDRVHRNLPSSPGYRIIHTKKGTSGLRHLVSSWVDSASFELYYKIRATSSSSEDRYVNMYIVDYADLHYEIASFLISSGAEEQTFEGVIDTSSWASLVDAQSRFEVRVFCEGECIVEALFFVPPDTYTGAWNVLPEWEHNSPVLGDGGVALLRDNIQWLIDNTDQRNFGSPRWYRHNTKARYEDFGVTTGFMFRRRYRFLHYYYDPIGEQPGGQEEWFDDATPEIVFIKHGEEEEDSLDVEDDERPGWYVVDLDSVDGLFTGMFYTVKGCAFAFEEDISIEQGALLSA